MNGSRVQTNAMLHALPTIHGVRLVFSSPRLSVFERIFWKSLYLLLSAKEIRYREVDDLVSSTVHHGAEHIKAETQCLLRTDRGRHREFLPVHDHLNQSRSFMSEDVFECRSQILW